MKNIVFWTLVALLMQIKAEKGICPLNCFCSIDNIAVKCRGLDKFPVFDFAADVRSLDFFHCRISDIKKEALHAYKNLENLDLRYNELKSVSPGLFSGMTSLKELYIANNPWSCDKSTLVVMQTELAELVDSNKNLEDFDGGKVQCFDPPSMKGRRPLHLINAKSRLCRVRSKDPNADDRHAAKLTAGAITMSIFVLVLVTVIIASIWACRQRGSSFGGSNDASDLQGRMEAGEKSPFIKKIEKKQPIIKVLPAVPQGTPSHRDRRNVDSTLKLNSYSGSDKKVLIDNKRRFDKLQGLSVSDKDSKSPLRDKMERKFHAVQVLPSFPKKSAHEQDRRKVDSTDSHSKSRFQKLQGLLGEDDEGKRKSPLLAKMEKKYNALQVLPVIPKSGASSNDRTRLGVTPGPNSRSKSDRSIFIDSNERCREPQSLPAHAKSSLGLEKKEKRDGQSDMDSKVVLADTSKQRRISLGHSFTAKCSYSSLSEGDGSHSKLDIKNKLDGRKKKHRKSHDSQLSAKSSSSSFEEIETLESEMINLDQSEVKDTLIENMEKRRRMSQGLPVFSTSSASSLEEDDNAQIVSAGNEDLRSEDNLIDSMKKRRRMSQGLPLTAESSTSSCEEDGQVISTDIPESEMQGQVKSDGILTGGVKKFMRSILEGVKMTGFLLPGQGFPTSSLSRATSDDDDLHGKEDDLADKEKKRHSGKEGGEDSDDSSSFHSLDEDEMDENGYETS